MPRVKLTDDRPERFRIWLRTYVQETCGIDKLAKRMGRSRATAYNRLRDPAGLTLENLHDIRVSTGMTVDELSAQIRTFL